VGWGVGGIEAEAVMLGQPIYMLLPEVIGVRLSGKLPEGTTATDLVLAVTQILRKRGVVEKFVEFFGSGLDALSLADRATIANMAPEYGATMGFFPVDEQTLDYLRQTGRDEALIESVRLYTQAQGLWRDDQLPIEYTDVIEIDLASIQPALAGPKRPQDKIVLSDMKTQFQSDLQKTYKHETKRSASFILDGQTHTLSDGDVVLASITSCTNTSNPSVLIAAGLVARKARKLGLNRKPWVKTSLAPGSRVVTDYLDHAGLTEDLDAIGFHTVGYGCATCIGNSGPVIPEIGEAIKAGDLAAAAVLSGNRNFEGRVNPLVQPSYLASPPLVVAYALAGTVDIDLTQEAIGHDQNGQAVYLKDIWPTTAEIQETLNFAVRKEDFVNRYHDLKGPKLWQAIPTEKSDVYAWNEASTYIQEPPFFVGMSKEVKPIQSISGARVLVKVADSVTTDHISPAGDIPEGPASAYLSSKGVKRDMFNSFGARRGNDRIMTRGTFANIRLKNELADGKEGGYTKYLGSAHSDLSTDQITSIYEASQAYQAQNIPLVVIAGKDYGMGSSRDWAAKGTMLLGVKAVIAETYERIHRSNLVGMGVLPLQFKKGEGRQSLGLTGRESLSIALTDELKPLSTLTVVAQREDGSEFKFDVTCRIDTPVEVEYYRNGGVLHTVLRRMASH
jgi:aconitate hydratase